jgi:hypothetical protein
MRRNTIIGLSCLALFLIAFVGGIVAVAPQAISRVNTIRVEHGGFGQLGISLCDDGGDESPAGRPGTT